MWKLPEVQPVCQGNFIIVFNPQQFAHNVVSTRGKNLGDYEFKHMLPQQKHYFKKR